METGSYYETATENPRLIADILHRNIDNPKSV
jgi:hypothetical protein